MKALSPCIETAVSGADSDWRTPREMPTRISIPGFSLRPGLGNSARAVIARVRSSTRVSSMAMRPWKFSPA